MNDNVRARKSSATVDLAMVTEQLAALRQEIALLAERVAALEAKSDGKGAPSIPRPIPQVLDEQTLAVISAAIAAFFGKMPRIRQIRLVGTTTWAQQGRLTIQTSHSLAAAHSRIEH